jgi:hypothetical protein
MGGLIFHGTASRHNSGPAIALKPSQPVRSLATFLKRVLQRFGGLQALLKLCNLLTAVVLHDTTRFGERLPVLAKANTPK